MLLELFVWHVCFMDIIANQIIRAMQPFTSPETRMQPMLLEVFTDKEKDTTLLREYYHGLKNKNE